MKRIYFGLGALLTAVILFQGLAPVAAEDKPSAKAEKGWVQLFNGKDLTGWKTFPKGTGEWKVVDGAIVGTGDASHLFSVRGDYTNFVYRVEAMINDKGNSGQYFRTKFEGGFPHGYEAQINSTHPDRIKTGSLYPGGGLSVSPEDRKAIVVYEMLVKPDTWFTQEVTAIGNHITIKVNGKRTVNWIDPKNTFTKGHFALQQHNLGSVVKFRKIEVKELPASEKDTK